MRPPRAAINHPPIGAFSERDAPWARDGCPRPLGAALFADPRVARQSLRFRQVRRGHELYDAARRRLDVDSAVLWARRSLFVFRGSRLLVTEVFLPAILALKP